jgi:sigma-54-specific transcriptional regulator
LHKAVAAGRFREDLYYRLKVAELALPALRDRPGDILPLAHYFLDLYRQRLGSAVNQLSPEAGQRLLQHAWPGNIRELENVIHSALLVSQGDQITAESLHIRPADPTPITAHGQLPAGPGDPAGALKRSLLALFDQNLPGLHAQIEETLMRTAFEYCHRNQLQTARLLGISRNIVRARLIQIGELSVGARGASGGQGLGEADAGLS